MRPQPVRRRTGAAPAGLTHRVGGWEFFLRANPQSWLAESRDRRRYDVVWKFPRSLFVLRPILYSSDRVRPAGFYSAPRLFVTLH